MWLGRRAASRAHTQSGEATHTGTMTSAGTTDGSSAKMYDSLVARHPPLATGGCSTPGLVQGWDAALVVCLAPSVRQPLHLTSVRYLSVQPDEKHEREAWEIPYMIAAVGTTAILVIGLTYKPKTSIKVC